jgi:hypothetical protein
MKRITMVAGLALAFSGCTADFATQNSADVLLIVAAVNAGAPLRSDVVGSGDTVASDTVDVDVAIRNKNTNAGVPVPNYLQAVIIERYEVRYYRSDGRSTQGVDVPYTISGNVTTAIDVATSGTASVPVEVVRAQAKLEPPLRNLRGVSSDPGGSALILTCFAEITLHGKTVAGDAVSGSGRLQIDFADWQ